MVARDTSTVAGFDEDVVAELFTHFLPFDDFVLGRRSGLRLFRWHSEVLELWLRILDVSMLESASSDKVCGE